MRDLGSPFGGFASPFPRGLAGFPFSTDPALSAVAADGWQATFGSPPASFDPEGDPKHLVVTRQGYSSSGSPESRQEALTVLGRVRQPYPNQGTLTADAVALSEFVYAGDTVEGVTNSSTRAYPKPIAMWLDHDLKRAVGQSYTARLAVAHAHAREGRPVAAVKFTATDGTNTVEQTVTAMSTITYPASGLTVPHFSATLDLSGLAADQLVTIDAVIYPWVGEAFTISVDGDTYPSPNLCVLKVLNDVAYGEAYAYVDAVAGDNGTGVVSATPATAQAAPFATIAAAASAIQTFNNTNYARNSASGGTIRLEEGTHTHSPFAAVVVTELPLVIEAVGARAATIWQDQGSSASNGCPDKLHIRGLTLKRNAASNVIFIDSAATLGGDNCAILEDVTLDDAGLGSYAFWFYRPGRVWMIGCDGDDVGITLAGGSTFKTATSIGSTGSCIGTGVYQAAGCVDLNGLFGNAQGATNRETARGNFLGWCHIGHGVDDVIVDITETIGPRGLAVVGCVIEDHSGGTQAAVKVSGDGVTNPVENVVWMGNTVIGQRSNMFYQDTGTVEIAKTGAVKYSVFDSWNAKGDVFSTNGALVGNWPVIYKVGARANAMLEGSDGSDTHGAGSWIGELPALGELAGSDAAPLNPAWTNDQTALSGGGDYTPGAGHGLPSIPAGLAPWSHDLKGRAVPNDGTAVAGAVQPL